MNDIRFPPHLTAKMFDELLVRLEQDGGFNDLYLATNGIPTIKKDGRLKRIGDRKLRSSEVEEQINAIYGANGATEIRKGGEIPTSHQVQVGRGVTYRYRVSGVAFSTQEGNKGIQLTFRSIAPEPIPLKDLNVEQGIIDRAYDRQGMVIIAGETGSGKSTLLAGFVDDMNSDSAKSDRVILTLESPIEYVHPVKTERCLVFQTEIPSMCPTFSEGVRRCLRRGPEVILIGEMRDQETIEAGVRASNTGHLVMTTLHANSAPEVIRRMVNEFDESVQAARLREIISALRLVVVQYLATTIDGKRVPCREFLGFPYELRTRLAKMAEKDIYPAIEEAVRKEGQSMRAAAQRWLDEGQIDAESFERAIAGT